MFRALVQRCAHTYYRCDLKKANGMNLSNYFQYLRFEYTKRLPETTSLSIELVVERVGYNSQSSLLRLFKQRLDISPNKYRKAYQQRVAN